MNRSRIAADVIAAAACQFALAALLAQATEHATALEDAAAALHRGTHRLAPLP